MFSASSVVNITSKFLRLQSKTFSVCVSGAKFIPINGKPNYDIKCSKLSNGLVVASIDNGSPISRISIMFKAGSRNEGCDTRGLTHVLRMTAGLTTRNNTKFLITRQLQKWGAELVCSSKRELVAYTLQGTNAAVKNNMGLLADIVTQPLFGPWELEENVPRLVYQRNSRSPEVRVIDLVHRAAFRDCGLGNSLFIPKHQIGRISSLQLFHYVCENFTSNRAAVVGVGVAHDELKCFAEELQLDTGDFDARKSCYYGGEIRLEEGGKTAHVALVGKGCALGKEEVTAFAVLQQIFGSVPTAVKGCVNSQGLFAKCMANKTQGVVRFSPLNFNYTDNGLFGVVIRCPAFLSEIAVTGAAEVLKNTQIGKTDFNRGKVQLKRLLLSSAENNKNLLQSLGVQVLFGKGVKDARQLARDVDKVRVYDVNEALKKVVSSKLSIASLGNLKTVPYLDELN